MKPDVIINGHIKYSRHNSKLTSLVCNNEFGNVKLDYLESKVFELLLDKPNSLIPYDEFLSHWKSSNVTDGVLSRVISLLRNKLRKVGCKDNIIINTPKKGYTLSTEVDIFSEITNEDAAIKVEEKTLVKFAEKRSNKTGINSFIVLAVLVVFVVLIVLVIKFNEEHVGDSLNFDSITTTKLLSDEMIKVEIAYNNFNDNIAYTSRSFNEQFLSVNIINRISGHNLQIAEHNKSISKPAWLSENEIMYREYDDNSCVIKKASLNLLTLKYSSTEAFTCNPNSYASSIARFDEVNILFTESTLNNIDSNLYKGNIETGKIKKIDIDNGGGVGIYNVITTANSNYIALLSSSDGSIFKIQLVDPNNSWLSLWSVELSVSNISVGWNGTYLSYKNNLENITVVKFKGDREIDRNSITILEPIYSLTSANNGLLFTAGELVSHNILLTDMDTEQHDLITGQSNSKNGLAKFYLDDFIIFVSNKTGLEQVWLYDRKKQTTSQVSYFTEKHQIDNFSIDKTRQLIALETKGKIMIYSLNDTHKLSTKSHEIVGVHPVFYQGKLVYSSYIAGDSNLYSWDLRSVEQPTLIVEGVDIANEDVDKLYFSGVNNAGIWEYKNGSENQLIFSLPTKGYRWLINQGVLTYTNDAGDYSRFNLKDKNTEKVNTDTCKNPLDFYKASCLSIIIEPSSNRIVLLDFNQVNSAAIN